MVFRIALVVIAVAAAVLNFRAEQVLHVLTKRDKFEASEIMRVKYIALAIVVAAVILIILKERGVIGL